jgi:hypothetical protein
MTEGDRIFKIWNLSGCGAREQWLVSLNMMVSKPVLHSQVSIICFLSLVEAKGKQTKKIPNKQKRRSQKVIQDHRSKRETIREAEGEGKRGRKGIRRNKGGGKYDHNILYAYGEIP